MHNRRKADRAASEEEAAAQRAKAKAYSALLHNCVHRRASGVSGVPAQQQMPAMGWLARETRPAH